MKKYFAFIAMVTMVAGLYAFSVDTEKPKTAENKSACATVENVVKTSAVECGGGAEVVRTANAEKAGCDDASIVKTANLVEKSAGCSESGGAEVVKTANLEKSGCDDANVVKTASIADKAADCSEAGGAEAVATKAEGACCSEKAETDSRIAENK
ncbi:MAG: hypothetical protein ACFCUM_01545 [Bacteroidales bacterium]